MANANQIRGDEMNTATRCCMCRRPTPNPAHEAVGPKRYNGWAPGRYVSKRQVWCAGCWQELLRANQKYHDDLMATNARILAELAGEPDGCYYCGSHAHRTSDCHAKP